MEQQSAVAIRAADLRAEIARQRVRIYKVASRAGIHPITIGRILSEKLGLSDRAATRIMDAIREEAAEQAAHGLR